MPRRRYEFAATPPLLPYYDDSICVAPRMSRCHAMLTLLPCLLNMAPACLHLLILFHALHQMMMSIAPRLMPRYAAFARCFDVAMPTMAAAAIAAMPMSFFTLFARCFSLFASFHFDMFRYATLRLPCRLLMFTYAPLDGATPSAPRPPMLMLLPRHTPDTRCCHTICRYATMMLDKMLTMLVLMLIMPMPPPPLLRRCHYLRCRFRFSPRYSAAFHMPRYFTLLMLMSAR